jgi:hypothetical protein
LLRGLIEPGDDVAKRWKDAPISAKRRIARAVLSAEILGELRVIPSPIRGGSQRSPATERVILRKEPPATSPDGG